jgi:hypothetical protein
MKARPQLLLGMFWLNLCASTQGQTPDPLNQWQSVASPRISIRGLAYHDRQFVAAGAPISMYSTNGRDWEPLNTQWTSRVFGTNNVGPIRDIIFVDGAFYLGDQNGRIWKSGRTALSSRPVISQVTHAGGQTTLSFATLPGFHYTVECADYLDSTPWRPCAGPLFAADSQLTVTDPDAAIQSRFYRIRVE